MSDQQDQNKDVLTPIEDAEVAEWTNSLDEASKLEIRRQALQLRAVHDAAKAPEKIDWGNLTDAEFAAAKRKLGIG